MYEEEIKKQKMTICQNPNKSKKREERGVNIQQSLIVYCKRGDLTFLTMLSKLLLPRAIFLPAKCIGNFVTKTH